MKIYISGSISKNPDYMEQFSNAEKKLQAAGHEAINPAKNTGETYKEFIDKGLLQEMECDAIYLLKGWQFSTGAHLEFEYAGAVGMQIMYEAEEKQ